MSLGLVSQSIWGGLVTHYVRLLLFCHTSHAASQLRVHSCSSLESHYLDTNLWLQSDRYCHQLGWTFLDSMATALESEQQLQQPRQASLTWPFSSSYGGNPLHTHATFAHQSSLSQPHHGNSSNLLSNHILLLLLNPVLSSHCDHLLLLFTGLANCYPFTETVWFWSKLIAMWAVITTLLHKTKKILSCWPYLRVLYNARCFGSVRATHH